ncbi:MAG: NADP-dependent oxidoreductase [Solirubrobacterales bacterium]|nr:NADP-dependent oxidoreductase [Solirubrobacterales bacterium]
MDGSETYDTTVGATMRAVRLHSPGRIEDLVVEEVATPRPEAGEALVRVHAAAITRDELSWPVDRLPATPSYEVSGTVVATAPDASEPSAGVAVYALMDFDRDGAAAEYALVEARLLADKPRTLDDVQSAAVPLPALSAWQGLFRHGGLAAGERVLIHGAAGGVGQFAVQLAHHHGAHVIGTASPWGLQLARELGADEVIDHTTTRFEDAVEPVDLVFDTVGGDRLQRSPAVLRHGGRLVSVAEQPPPDVLENPAIRAVFFVVEPDREQLIRLTTLIDAGHVRPLVGEVFALADAREAFARAMAGNARGKVVIQITSRTASRGSTSPAGPS